MSGLVKAKKYDWKDSNMAMFGSDTEKQVKKESAESEPAWQGSGQKVGLQIWRIEQFEVKSWPEEDYGKFFEGDSYIILNTYKEDDSDELKYDVHFWIGKFSTQDEYGTAAYKTVELDTFHDDKPVQHREVQQHESQLFKSYFKTIQYLKGGAASGFKHVLPEEYTPRLFKVKKEDSGMKVTQVPRCRKMLDEGDVFILDMGLTLYQWNGKSCTAFEKFEGAKQIEKIKSERNGEPEVQILEEANLRENDKFYDAFDEEEDDEEPDVEGEGDTVLKKVSDADGSLDLEDVKEGDVTMADLSSDDVYLIDTRKALYVWVGSGASVDEKRNAMGYAHKYLQSTPYCFIPVTVLSEGSKNAEFEQSIPQSA